MAKDIDKVNNVIHLTKPWNKGLIKSGTQLGQCNSGGTYEYFSIPNDRLTTSWQRYTLIVSGVYNHKPTEMKTFRPTTDSIRLLFLLNRSSTSNEKVTFSFRNIVVKKVSN